MRFEPGEAVGEKAPFPSGRWSGGGVELGLDRVVGGVGGEQEQDLGARHEPGGQRLRAGDLFQLVALPLVQVDGLAFKWHA